MPSNQCDRKTIMTIHSNTEYRQQSFWGTAHLNSSVPVTYLHKITVIWQINNLCTVTICGEVGESWPNG